MAFSHHEFQVSDYKLSSADIISSNTPIWIVYAWCSMLLHVLYQLCCCNSALKRLTHFSHRFEIIPDNIYSVENNAAGKGLMSYILEGVINLIIP